MILSGVGLEKIADCLRMMGGLRTKGTIDGKKRWTDGLRMLMGGIYEKLEEVIEGGLRR